VVRQIVAICDACKLNGQIKIAVGEFNPFVKGMIWKDVCSEHYTAAKIMGCVTKLFDTLGDAVMEV